MRLAGPGWILIAIFLVNLSAGMFLHSAPERHAVDKSGAATSEAGTRHIPADLRMDGETVSLSVPQMSSSAPAVLLLSLEGAPKRAAHGIAQRSPGYIPSDLLQLQHVFRI